MKKKAVIITTDKFEDVEVTYPYYRLLEEDMIVDIATPKGKPVTGKLGQTMYATKQIENLKEKEYSLVIIPGGIDASEELRNIPAVLKFIKEMNKKKKIIASICHGPWILISAGIVKNISATCYPAMKDDLINAGSDYKEQSVVCDNNIITSQRPRYLPRFMKTILQNI